MRYIFILYIFDAINTNLFICIFGQALDTLTKNAPRIAFFCGQRQYYFSSLCAWCWCAFTL